MPPGWPGEPAASAPADGIVRGPLPSNGFRHGVWRARSAKASTAPPRAHTCMYVCTLFNMTAGVHGRQVRAVAPRGSEERRVGKECVGTCGARWSPQHYNKNHLTT